MSYFPLISQGPATSKTARNSLLEALANLTIAAGIVAISSCTSQPQKKENYLGIENQKIETNIIGLDDFAKSLDKKHRVLIGWPKWDDETNRSNCHYLNNPSREMLESEIFSMDIQGLREKSNSTRDVLGLTTRLQRQGVDFYITTIAKKFPISGFHCFGYYPTLIVSGVPITRESAEAMAETYSKVEAPIEGVFHLRSGKLEKLFGK